MSELVEVTRFWKFCKHAKEFVNAQFQQYVVPDAMEIRRCSLRTPHKFSVNCAGPLLCERLTNQLEMRGNGCLPTQMGMVESGVESEGHTEHHIAHQAIAPRIRITRVGIGDVIPTRADHHSKIATNLPRNSHACLRCEIERCSA